MIKNETLSEKWFKFRRYYFMDGFIDIWFGDCADNPNLDKKSPWNLNAFATYARLNGGGEWTSNMARRSVILSDEFEDKPVQEVWNDLTYTE